MLGMCEKRLGNSGSALALLENSFPRIEDTKLRVQVGMDLLELEYAQGNLAKAIVVLQTLDRTDPANTNV